LKGSPPGLSQFAYWLAGPLAPNATRLKETQMKVIVKSFRPSRKDSVLAEAVIELADGEHNATVDGLRILRNKQGAFWVAMPSYAVPLAGGHGYEYRPTVSLSRKLQRQVEDAVLAAFEEWQRGDDSGSLGGGG
jgi:hypothetical protein